MVRSKLKSPTISTHFQRSLKELENSISGVRRRRQKVDGYSNEKRRRGSITHPLKSAILLAERGPTAPELTLRRHCDVSATSQSESRTQTEWNQFRVKKWPIAS
jgi:hypothetical protein